MAEELEQIHVAEARLRHVIAERWVAGESIPDLQSDYGKSYPYILKAIKWAFLDYHATVEADAAEIERLTKIAEPTFSGPTLAAAFALSASLYNGNAYHVKRGIRLQDQTRDDVIEHMREEVGELKDAPSDIFELADLFCLCSSYAARMGWTESDIAGAMTRKMTTRFALDEDATLPASPRLG